MEAITTFLNRYKSQDFATRYPEYRADDGKIHVLYFSCYANGTGFYRFVLPVMHLNQTETHSAILGDIYSWDHSRQTERNANLDSRLIQWAHYIVFPTITSKMKAVLDYFKDNNPNVKFCMDIDDNLHKIQYGNPAYKKDNSVACKALIENMNEMDYIISPSQCLNDFYKSITTKPEFKIFNNLLSEYLVDDIPKIKKAKKDKFRIGLIVNEGHTADIIAFKKTLMQINKTFKDSVEIVIMGFNRKSILGGVKYTYVPDVPFTEYYKAVQALNLDGAIIPLRNSEFNRCKTFQRYLELSQFQIPVMVYTSPVYRGVIEHEIDGLFCDITEDFIAEIELLMIDVEETKKMAQTAFTETNRKWSFNTGIATGMKQLKAIF